MYEEKFSSRIAELRMKKGVSARDMSLSLGQNQGYINNIETGKSLPSMTSFFYICEYLGVTPKEFFDFESSQPSELSSLCDDLNKLTESQFEIVQRMVEELVKKR